MVLKKVVSFERSPEFYFDLGYKYIQKGNLKTALRYIQKAAKAKPEDAFVQFNYAGLLAELGDIELSTEVLLRIVESIAPGYAECYFGLGCNYLQLQKLKKAIEYFEKYLAVDPDGEFAEESEDLLDMLVMIKDANNNLDDDELDKIYKLEEEAIAMLEKKEYDKAVEMFESVVELLPNAVPARNNLSLTHYYLGNVEKAIELAREVLNYEPDNVHASCNLAVYYNRVNYDSWVEKQVKSIKMLNTDNPDYLFKIADTLGTLGRHSDSYKCYKRLISIETSNPLYTHYTAAAAFNSGRLKEAIRLWEDLKQLDAENFLSDYYIALASEYMEGKEKPEPLLYIYQLPKDEVNSRIDKIYKFMELSGQTCESFLKDSDVSTALYFGMIFDKHFIRKLIFNKIKMEHLAGAETLLREFAVKSDAEDYMKVEAVLLMDILGSVKPYKINFNGSIIEVSEEPLEVLELENKSEWQEVIKAALKNMYGRHAYTYEDDITKLWYSYIKHVYPDIPDMPKPGVWAAALEYTYSKLNRQPGTQLDVAKLYGVSSGALGEKYRQIISALKGEIERSKI